MIIMWMAYMKYEDENKEDNQKYIKVAFDFYLTST